MPFIQVPPNSTGGKVSVRQVSDGVNTLNRQEVVIGDPAVYDGVAEVQNINPAVTDYGLTVRPATTGSRVFHLVVGAGANPTLIKLGAGKITGWHIFNNTGIVLYPKFHDVGVVPTPGQNVMHTIGVQAGEPDSLSTEIEFSTGIGFTIVEGIADGDTSGVQASTCVVNIYYE